jgi:hypothetical protein
MESRICVRTVVDRMIRDCRLGNLRCGVAPSRIDGSQFRKKTPTWIWHQPLQGAEKVEKTTGVTDSLSHHETNLTKWSLREMSALASKIEDRVSPSKSVKMLNIYRSGDNEARFVRTLRTRWCQCQRRNLEQLSVRAGKVIHIFNRSLPECTGVCRESTILVAIKIHGLAMKS